MIIRQSGVCQLKKLFLCRPLRLSAVASRDGIVHLRVGVFGFTSALHPTSCRRLAGAPLEDCAGSTHRSTSID
jgi:hypothetical protein